MTLDQRFKKIQNFKFSFSKSNVHAKYFAIECGAASMYDNGFGLNIPNHLSNENKLRAVFINTLERNGIFLFNISGVDMKKAKRGFKNYIIAENNNLITEWELFMILNNSVYLKNCIFHNGKVEFKKRIIWNSVK